AFAQFGTRGAGTVARHVPLVDGADSAFAAAEAVIGLPHLGTVAISVPLVDERERLRGALLGTGGAAGATLWWPLAAPGAQWSAALDALRGAERSAGARDVHAARGRVRPVPIRAGLALMQPTYQWRSAGGTVPALVRINVMVGDSVRSIVPPNPALPGADGQGGDFRASVRALHAAMRDALRRGDWAAFGRAFEALGRLTGSPSRP